MTPFNGWTVAMQETSSVIAGNSVRSTLVPMSCAQARSQAVEKKFTIATLSAHLAISVI